MMMRILWKAAGTAVAGTVLRMRRTVPDRCHDPPLLSVSFVAIALCIAGSARSQNSLTDIHRVRDAPPYWAYTVDPPAPAPDVNAQPDAHKLQRVPGSTAAFTLGQIGDYFDTPDWHPGNHPKMPTIVAHGRKPEVFACTLCHLPNGQGHPENASLAGLPVGYILQQLTDFKSGRRKSAEPRHLPTAYMIGEATKANAEERQAAAEYFSGLTPRPWIRVVETNMVPSTHVAGWMLVPSSPAKTEPIGQRIIETPGNLERTELRDDASGFIAYVPVGSIDKGASLVKTGGAGKTIPCGTCHGEDLQGIGNVPRLAARSPSYIVRQLYDIQHGARAGIDVELMQAPVARLTMTDMISIAAYAASLRP